MGNFTKGSWRLAVIPAGSLTPSAEVVKTTKTLIDAGKLLGGGENAGNPTDTKLPAPPWWLLALTALMLMSFFNTIN